MAKRAIAISIESSPTPEELQIIGNGLRQYNDQHVPADKDSSFAVFLRGEDGMILGGVFARAGRGWLKISEMWVDESVRGQGYGSRLIDAAETEGMKRNCHGAYLDTFSFQAPKFYQKRGYEIFGALAAFPNEHKRFFMRKSLNRSGGDNE